MGHNARTLAIRDAEDIAEEMRRVGAEAEGIARMLPKAQHYLVKLEGIRTAVAHILKESLLSAGGDAVVSRDVITGKTERTDALLIGSAKHFASLIAALRAQKFGAPDLAAEIETALSHFDSSPSSLPADVKASPRLRSMFETMTRRTLVMGILNVTPDSFSDGGLFLDRDAAAATAVGMIKEGADIIDVGGESSRPGAEPVAAEEELGRVLPVIERLRESTDVVISVDTCKSSVARAALAAGADIVNDISGMSFDPEMRAVVAEARAAAILMHMKGTPRDMQENPLYSDLLSEVTSELLRRVEDAVAAGVDERLILIDPGFGFGKTVEHNLVLLRRLREFKSLGRPIVIGTSRKSTIGKVLGGLPAEERLEGTAATVAISIMNGANVVRVHDVKEMARAARVTDAVLGS
ncbi:MAG: dihydropteroate synthase [Armatimonadota bacterium]|nr:dihydropteroate synthase [Armatimonadota bacterium]